MATSSEQIAKDLKGAGLSSKKRIATAARAWRSSDIFFPNKDDFLFEWLCSALGRPNLKDLSECALLQIDYWQLLHDLLEHYVQIAKADHHHHDRRLPTIRVNLVAAMGTLLHYLYVEFKNDTEKRSSMLRCVQRSAEILLSDTFALSYRPTFEHLATVVDHLLTALETQMLMCNAKDNENESEAMRALVELSLGLLNRFDLQIVQSPNQKKVFKLVVGKSFQKLLSVRRHTQDEALALALTDILTHTLFHADTILEYTSVVKEKKEMKHASYVANLFEALTHLVADPANDDQRMNALNVLPVLLQEYVKAYRGKRSSLVSSSAVQEAGRMIEFDFFEKLLSIAKAAEQYDRTASIRVLEQMLRRLAELNIYDVRQDDSDRTQTKILESISTEMVGLLEDSTFDQGLVLDLAGALLQVDFGLIESSINSLWPVMVQPPKEAEPSCLQFITHLLSTYAAARQIDVFITELLEALQNSTGDHVDEGLAKPLFSNQFLQQFSACIAKHMPPAQARLIFEQFTAGLQASMSSPQRAAISRYTSLFAAAFIKNLRLSQQQGKWFEKATVDLFESFVKPTLELSDTQCALSALQIHFTLTSTLIDVYWRNLTSENRTWLITTCSFIFNLSLQQNTRTANVVTVVAANVMLQHAYLTHLLGIEGMGRSETVEPLNAVLDLVIGESGSDLTWRQDRSWDGLLTHVNDAGIAKLACWKLVTDEWFDVVCQFVDKDRAEKLAAILLSSFPETPVCSSEGGVVNVPSLNAVLLRSATFYEARCFKDCYITMLMETLIELFTTQLQHHSCNETGKQLAKTIARIHPRQSYTMTETDKQHLKSILTADTMQYTIEDGRISFSTDHVKTVAAYIQLWLLLPIEYYEKSERQYGLLLSVLIDAWVVSSVGADPHARIKTSLMCRTLYLRIIQFNSSSHLLSAETWSLQWLLQSVEHWKSCGLSEEPTELVSLQEVTEEIDRNVLLTILTRAGAKNAATHATAFFQDTLHQRLEHMRATSPKRTADSMNWVANLLMALNQYLSNHTKRQKMEMVTNPYVSKVLRSLSITVAENLRQSKSTIESSLKDDYSSDIHFAQLARVLLLARLLQELARYLGTQCDDVVDTKTLTRDILALTTPFIQYLQLCLRGKASGPMLDLTAAFIAVLCTTLSRHPHVDATKRVLAVIWLVYSLMSKATGHENSLKMLTNSFSLWVQSLNDSQFEELVRGFVEQADEEVARHKDGDRSDAQKTLVSLLSLLVSSSSEAQKSKLRKFMPLCVLKLSTLMGSTRSVEFLEQGLSLLRQLSKDKAISFSKYDVALVLSCLLQVASPSTEERLRGQVDRPTAHRLFEGLCSVLLNLVYANRQSLVSSLPAFTALVQALLHCFKSTHLSLVGRSKKRKEKSQPRATNRTAALLFAHAPLDTSAAQLLARLLSSLPQKSVGSDAWSAHTHAMFYRAVARHAPYLLYEYFAIQSNPTMSIALPHLKAALMPGLYSIMDMCTDNDHSLLMAMLEGPAKGLLKAFYNSWKEEHKYKGQ